MASGALITIDVSTAVLLLLGAVNLLVLGPVAWILKGALADIKELTRNFIALKDMVQREYVHGNIYNRDVTEIKELLRQIFDKLDGKADKERT